MDLNDKENTIYNTICDVINGIKTRKEAEYELSLSRQQIYRLVNIYHSDGKSGFIHKNRGKSNPNKIDKNIILEIEKLYLDEYYDYNLKHFFEEIKDRYDISYPSLYTYFLNDDIISPIAHKGTVKLYNEKMDNAIQAKEISKEKFELFQSRQIVVLV